MNQIADTSHSLRLPSFGRVQHWFNFISYWVFKLLSIILTHSLKRTGDVNITCLSHNKPGNQLVYFKDSLYEYVRPVCTLVCFHQ